MFGKLVKHEFRATARIIPFVFLVTIILALVNVVSGSLDLGFVSGLSMGLVIFMSIAQISIVIVLLIWRYYKNLYANEGYLSHTLPVKTSMHLWSKLLVGFVWMLLSYIVSLLSMFMAGGAALYRENGNLNAISETYNTIITLFGLKNHQTAMWLVIGMFLLAAIILVLTESFFAVSLGSISKLHSLGIGGPILVFVIGYIVMQIVQTSATLLIPIGLKITSSATGDASFQFVREGMLPSVISQMNETVDPAVTPVIVGLGYYLLVPFLAAGLLFITARIISKNTSIR